MVMGRWWLMYYLTVIKTFSPLFSEKYFFSFVIPPFHLLTVIVLIISGLCVVELWVEYGWNYMKFHPNSTHNSTLSNALNAKYITIPRWKSGTSFAKKYFLRIIVGKLWIDVNFAIFHSNTLHKVAPNQSSPGIRGGLATPGRGGEGHYVKAMLLGGKSIVIRR